MNEADLKYVEENNLVSFMNKTKWQELANGLTSNKEFEPKVSVKILRDNSPSGFSLLDWEWVKRGNSSCIEWIEIDPVKRERTGALNPDIETDYSGFVVSVLNQFNIPYSVKGKNFVVHGHADSSNQPQYV